MRLACASLTTSVNRRVRAGVLTDLRHLGVQALAHLGAAMVDLAGAVGIHMNQCAGLVVYAEEAHYKAGRAKAALRAVALQHRLLRGCSRPSAAARSSTVHSAMPSIECASRMQLLMAR